MMNRNICRLALVCLLVGLSSLGLAYDDDENVYDVYGVPEPSEYDGASERSNAGIVEIGDANPSDVSNLINGKQITVLTMKKCSPGSFDKSVLKDQVNLTSLIIIDCYMPKIEAGAFCSSGNIQSITLQNVEFEEPAEINKDMFIGCENSLKTLKIAISDTKRKRITVAKDAFSKLNALNTIALENLDLPLVDETVLLRDGLFAAAGAGIQTLRINRCQVNDAVFGSTFKNLTVLDLKTNKLIDIAGLKLNELVKLEQIHLQENLIELVDLGIFKNLPNLEMVFLSGNPILNIINDKKSVFKSPKVHVSIDLSANSTLSEESVETDLKQNAKVQSCSIYKKIKLPY